MNLIVTMLRGEWNTIGWKVPALPQTTHMIEFKFLEITWKSIQYLGHSYHSRLISYHSLSLHYDPNIENRYICAQFGWIKEKFPEVLSECWLIHEVSWEMGLGVEWKWEEEDLCKREQGQNHGLWKRTSSSRKF